jgi:hypothetical protein
MARRLWLLLALLVTGCGARAGGLPEPTRTAALEVSQPGPPSDTPSEWAQIETPDGAMSLLGPADWAAGTAIGFIRLAPDEATLTAAGVPEEPRVTFVIVTGPGRAQDFGLDGRSAAEVYATFAMYPDSRVGPSSEVDGMPWPGLEGHRSTPAAGDFHLNVLMMDEQTFLVIQSYAPAGEWQALEPLLDEMIESLAID